MFVTAVLLAAMLQPVEAADRKEFVACLNKAVADAKGQSVTPDMFGDFAHKSCATIEANFKDGLVKFGVKNGLSRKLANEDAQLQIDDYVYTAEQRYRDQVEHASAQ